MLHKMQSLKFKTIIIVEVVVDAFTLFFPFINDKTSEKVINVKTL